VRSHDDALRVATERDKERYPLGNGKGMGYVTISIVVGFTKQIAHRVNLTVNTGCHTYNHFKYA
jgi:hypothetical protein